MIPAAGESHGLAHAQRRSLRTPGSARAALPLVLTFTHGFGEIPKIRPFLPTIQLACVAGVINRVVRSPRGWIVTLLELPLVAWIGRLSYSLYLWQQLFTLDVWAKPWRAPRFPLNLIPIFLASMFSYYVIEKPLQRVRARFRPETTRPPRTIAAYVGARGDTMDAGRGRTRPGSAR